MLRRHRPQRVRQHDERSFRDARELLPGTAAPEQHPMRQTVLVGLRRTPTRLSPGDGVAARDTRLLRARLPQTMLPGDTEVRDKGDDPEDKDTEGGTGVAERERGRSRNAKGGEQREREGEPAGTAGERGVALFAPHPNEEPQRQQQLRDERIQEPRKHLTKV